MGLNPSFCDVRQAISPLRQRMIDDMTARRFSEKVQKAYVRHVRTFQPSSAGR
jgi:hypothetical protein